MEAGPSRGGSKATQAILWGTLIAGVLDITSAFLIYGVRGVSPIQILQSVASGLLGRNSYEGGLGTATLGAVLHFFIAFVACALYYLASRKIKILVQHAVICGLLYGAVVYFVMNNIVVPLSRFPGDTSFQLYTGLLVHMLMIGLPIALVVRRFAR
jgi:hypothetical protein